MARGPNQLKTVVMPLSTTHKISKYLEQLVDSGFYGKNATEAAERVLADSVKQLVEAGKLKRISTKAGRKAGPAKSSAT